MNKKILTISIVAVLMLVAISFSSAVSSNTSKPIRKESPLFGIRTRRAISERVGEVIENIKTKYIGERVFFLPFQFIIRNIRSGTYTDPFPCTIEGKTGDCHLTCHTDC